MMDHNPESNFTLYSMLILCVMLAGMNSVELHKIALLWKQMPFINFEVFDSCLKYQYIIKTFFCLFSLLATISALILTLGILFNSLFMSRKLMDSYLNFVYYIFGPFLLVCSSLGLNYWQEITQICYYDTREKYFSISNASSIIFCFMLSVALTLIVEFYNSLDLYSNSITRQPNGSKGLAKIFWFVALKFRNSTSSIFQAQSNSNREYNVNINHNNNNNLQDNSNISFLSFSHQNIINNGNNSNNLNSMNNQNNQNSSNYTNVIESGNSNYNDSLHLMNTSKVPEDSKTDSNNKIIHDC